MGRTSVSSETVFRQPPEAVFDFVSNPANWGTSYSGSGGVEQKLELPLKLGDAWEEKIDLPPNRYIAKWTLITVARPRKFVFQQIDHIGKTADGSSDGVDGFCTISYTFEQAGEDTTLFTRELTLEVPKGVSVPDDLLTVSARPAGIDRYHESVKEQLSEKK